MADASPLETNPQSAEAAPKTSSKAKEFVGWLQRFGKKAENPKPASKSTNPEQFAEFIDVYPQKKFTVSSFIANAVREKGLKPPYFESQGASGSIHATNEKVNPELILKLRSQKQAPDGYLVGVGGGNWASMLDSFPPDKPPKGIVLINVDPKSIDELNQLVAGLKGEREMPKDFDGYHKYKDLPESEYLKRVYQNGGSNVFTPGVINRHLELLQKLAREGNISIVQQSILDPRLLDSIDQLPEFHTSNNIVYLSNISDWIWRAAEDRQRDKLISSVDAQFEEVNMAEVTGPFEALQSLKSGPENKNYYVDTTQKSLGYKVRISSKVPEFKLRDFDGNDFTESNLEIPDQIEGEPNLEAEGEYKNMNDVDVLKEFYKLKENPNYQNAMREQIERINNYRAELGSAPLNYEGELIPGLGYELRLVEMNRFSKSLGKPADPNFRIYPLKENNWLYWVTSQEVIKMAQLYNRLFSETRGGVPRGSTADYLADVIMQTYRIKPSEVKPPSF